jgi:hypothetical protein
MAGETMMEGILGFFFGCFLIMVALILLAIVPVALAWIGRLLLLPFRIFRWIIRCGK